MKIPPAITRVLVVDDDEGCSALATTALRQTLGRACVIRRCASAERAQAALLKRPADLILLDIELPGLDGRGLLRTLKSDPRTAGVPIIMMTGVAPSRAMLDSVRAGAADRCGNWTPILPSAILFSRNWCIPLS